MLGLGIAWMAWLSPQDDLPPAPGGGAIMFTDVAGWYRRTPDEAAVITPFDLTLDGLPAGLPMRLGDWTGRARRHDPAVDRWFRDPDVVIERTYTRPDGELVWVSAFGSRGDKSFHLFEHTPDTCYPLGGWAIESLDIARMPLGPRPLAVNHGTARGGRGQLVFMYWYVWDSPARDAARGVLSIRVSAPVRRDPQATLAMLAEDFVPRIFPRTLAWSRF